MAIVDLARFRRRVHLLHLLRGGLVGLAFGSWLACVILAYDWFVRPLNWTQYIPVLALVGFLAGVIWAFSNRPSDSAIAQSLDRRLGLEDRVSSARELSEGGHAFSALVERSGQQALAAALPARAFPLRWTRDWTHALLAVLFLVALGVVFTQQPWVPKGEKSGRAALAAAAPEIERIQKETVAQPRPTEESKAEAKRIAQELEKLQKQLERERLSPQEAEARAAELANDLDQLETKRQEALQDRAKELKTAREALLDAKRQEIAQAMPPDRDALEPTAQEEAREQARAEQLREQIAKLGKKISEGNLTPQERERIEAEMQNLEQELEQLRQLEELRREADQLQRELSQLKAEEQRLRAKLQDPNLTAQQRGEIQRQLAENQAKQQAAESQLKELQEAAKLAQELQQAMQELMANEAYQEMMRMAEEMMRRAAQEQQAQQGQGEKPRPMTEDEMREMIDRIRELQEALQDEENAQRLLEEMRQALESGECQQCEGGMPLLMAMGMAPGQFAGRLMPGGSGSQAGGEDRMLNDSGKVNTTRDTKPSRGETRTSAVRGTPRPDGGPSQYVEIKAPTFAGRRSSVPYREVLPRYQQRADRAIERQQIERRHQRRVRDYFESLK